MLFSDLYKIMVNKVTFVVFTGGNGPLYPPFFLPVKTDTIWQPRLQRQLGVTMYGGSYVVNLFKQKVV